MNKSDKVKKSSKTLKDKPHKKIIEHLNSVEKSLKANNLLSFFTFPDTKTFTKIKKSYEEMEELLKKNPNKYKKRKLAYITFQLCYKGVENLLKRQGTYIMITILIYTVDRKGSIINKKYPNRMLRVQWKEQDFAVSKITMKLINKLVQLASEEEIATASFYGSTLRAIIDRLQKVYEIDISDVLEPLF